MRKLQENLSKLWENTKYAKSEFNKASTKEHDTYRLFISVVLPRPSVMLSPMIANDFAEDCAQTSTALMKNLGHYCVNVVSHQRVENAALTSAVR